MIIISYSLEYMCSCKDYILSHHPLLVRLWTFKKVITQNLGETFTRWCEQVDPSQAVVDYSEPRHSSSSCKACCRLTTQSWVPPWKLHLFQRSCLAQSYTLNGSLHPVNSVEQRPSSLASKCHPCVTAFIPWEWADTFVVTSVNQTLALTNPFFTPLQVVYLRPLSSLHCSFCSLESSPVNEVNVNFNPRVCFLGNLTQGSSDI